MVGIAQLVSASDCGSEGRGFESHYPPSLLGMLGYRQGVRHRTLTPTFAGSNPASPVINRTCLLSEILGSGSFFGVRYSFSFQIKEQQETPAWALSLVKHVAVWDCQKNI